jgi:hypothetical protein
VTSETVEGIRALAVDKDHSPRWNPAGVEEVTPDMVGVGACAFTGYAVAVLVVFGAPQPPRFDEMPEAHRVAMVPRELGQRV